MNLTPEQEFEARASTLSREELCLMAKELWCELDSLKIALAEALKSVRELIDDNENLQNECPACAERQRQAGIEAAKDLLKGWGK